MREKIKESLNKIDTDKLVDTTGDVISASFKLLKELGKAAEVGFEMVEVVVTEGFEKVKESVKKEVNDEEDLFSEDFTEKNDEDDDNYI